jgi:hypothetical protein
LTPSAAIADERHAFLPVCSLRRSSTTGAFVAFVVEPHVALAAPISAALDFKPEVDFSCSHRLWVEIESPRKARGTGNGNEIYRILAPDY